MTQPQPSHIAAAVYLFLTVVCVAVLGMTENKLLLILSGCALGALLMAGSLAIIVAYKD
jgi:hypothetical protein